MSQQFSSSLPHDPKAPFGNQGQLLDELKRRQSELLSKKLPVAWINEKLQNSLHPNQIKNLNALKSGEAVAVITGQQPCLLGGPSLTLHKILHCISICDWLNKNDIKAIPMFWSASEDHDLYEMLRLELWNEDFTPQTFKLTNLIRGYAAETFEEPKDLHRQIKPYLSPWLQEAFFSKSIQRFVDPFHHALDHCFGESGLIWVEPKDFAHSATDFWRKVNRESEKLLHAYESDEAQLIQGKQTIQAPRRHGLPLFTLNQRNGKREALSYRNQLFTRGQNSQSHLQSLLQENERFSPGALLRPILAQSQLPILISVLGPAEYQYHRQLPKAYEVLQEYLPLLWPRLGGTYLPDSLVEFFSLNRNSLIEYIKSTQKKWLHNLPQAQNSLGEIETQLMKLEQEFHNETLQGTGAIQRFKDDMKKSLHRFRRGVQKLELAHQGWPRQKIELCENLLLPKGQYQERRLGWVQFLDHPQKLKELQTHFSDPFDFSHRIYS